MCRNTFISIKSIQTIWDYFHVLLYGVLCGFFLSMCICGIFSIIRSLFLHSSHNDQNISLCGINCGLFIIALAKNALNYDNFQMTWILFSLRHNFMYYMPVCTCLHTYKKCWVKNGQTQHLGCFNPVVGLN